MLKVGDLVKHRQFAWIGQVVKSEKQWPDWQCLSNWQCGMYPWIPYYRVKVILEEDGLILADQLEEWEVV